MGEEKWNKFSFARIDEVQILLIGQRSEHHRDCWCMLFLASNRIKERKLREELYFYWKASGSLKM